VSTSQHRQEYLSSAYRLVVLVILLAILAAILFGSFSLILPPHRWAVWRVPVLIAAAGVVALVIARASYSSARHWVMDGLAAVLGLASAVPSIAITLLITYGLSLHVAEHEGSRDSFIYQMTDPAILWQLLYFAIIPAVSGIVGLWIARRPSRAAARVSLAAMAARFSMLGLALSVMIVATAAVGAICRRVMWP
jgi:hypothetical protein